MPQTIDLKKQKRKFLVTAVSLTIINLLVYNIFNRNGGYNMAGAYIPYSFAQAFKSSLLTLLLAIPLLSAVLALAFALIPYKELAYAKKYSIAVLLLVIVLNASILLLQVVYLSKTKQEAKQKHEDRQIERLDEFKKEMLTYKDSMLYYLDHAIEEAKSASDLIGLAEKYDPPLDRYEFKIDSLSKAFHSKLPEYGLNQLDYETCMRGLMQDFTILTSRY